MKEQQKAGVKGGLMPFKDCLSTVQSGWLWKEMIDRGRV
jgi:hypothetical protein